MTRQVPTFRLDAAALARAEAALRSLSSEFDAWTAEELARLEAARRRVRAEPWGAAAWAELHRSAHDLKGLGSTYGHPLATRICASLCRLLDGAARHGDPPLALVDAHVEAAHAVVAHPPGAHEGAVLCEALEARVAEATPSPAAA